MLPIFRDWLLFLLNRTSTYIRLFFLIFSGTLSMNCWTLSEEVNGPGGTCFFKKSRSSNFFFSVFLLASSFLKILSPAISSFYRIPFHLQFFNFFSWYSIFLKFIKVICQIYRLIQNHLAGHNIKVFLSSDV